MVDVDRYRITFALFVLFFFAFCVVIFFVRRHFDRKALTHNAPSTPYVPKPGDAYRIFWGQYISSGGRLSAVRDGLDMRLFGQMSRAELRRAEFFMLLNIADWRSVYGLGRIRSRWARWPLKVMQKLMIGSNVIYVEQALMRISVRTGDIPTGDRTRAILGKISSSKNVFVGGKSVSSRITAAHVLETFPSPETAAALLKAIKEDPEYRVRFWAANSLLYIHGYAYPELGQHMKEIAPKLLMKERQADPEAIRRIEELIAGRAIGIVDDSEKS